MAKARPATLSALLVLALTGPSLAANDFRDVAIVSATITMVLESERSGVKVPWSNPETGNSGYVVAERTFFLDPKSPCRDYRRSMRNAAGETLVVTGTGCRTPDGRWELDEEAKAQPAGSLASRDPGTGAEPRRSAIGGSPGAEPRPEPPTPLTRSRSGSTRVTSRPVEVGEPTESGPATVARAPKPAAPAPEPASSPTAAPTPLPEPAARAPEPLRPPVAEPEPQTAPPKVTPKAAPAPKTPPESKTAARSEPTPPREPPTSRTEPRVSVSLPSKSEG